jgi:hypothetical protein
MLGQQRSAVIDRREYAVMLGVCWKWLRLWYRWAGEIMVLRRLRRGHWSRLLPLLRLWRCHGLTLGWRLQLIVRGVWLHLAWLLLMGWDCRWHRLPTVVLHHSLRYTRVLRVLVRIWWRIGCLWWRPLHLRLRCSLRIVERLVRCVGVSWLGRRSLGMLWVTRWSEVRACAAEMLRRVLLRMLHWML